MSRFELKAKFVQKFPLYILFNFRNSVGANHSFVF